MSRVGKQPIVIPSGIRVSVEGTRVTVEGPQGEMSAEFDSDLRIEHSDAEIRVDRPTDSARHRSLHGLTRSLIANMVHGVREGYERSLEIHGVGYRVQQKGKDLSFNVGFSHAVLFKAPPGITLMAETPTLVRVRGVDKQLVGEVAAEIRQIRPPEPYKGKGIRYVGERVRRKAGKSTVGGV
ncbi:MAG: 50S ribosomal protein L6 [Gemmatimonadota bacterium]